MNLGQEIQEDKHFLLWQQDDIETHRGVPWKPPPSVNLRRHGFPQSPFLLIVTSMSHSVLAMLSPSLSSRSIVTATYANLGRVLTCVPVNPNVRGKHSPPCPYSICSSAVTIIFLQGWPHQSSLLNPSGVSCALQNRPWHRYRPLKTAPSDLNESLLLLHSAMKHLQLSAALLSRCLYLDTSLFHSSFPGPHAAILPEGRLPGPLSELPFYFISFPTLSVNTLWWNCLQICREGWGVPSLCWQTAWGIQ